VANFLEQHKEVEQVRYPFLSSHPQYELAKQQMKAGGGIITMVVKGGLERAKNMIDSLEMIKYTSNLGDSRSIATHPASTTHSKLSQEQRATLGIQEGSIRLSIGLEYVNDIIEDIDRALLKSK
ncbi:MAG TPA: PLP-dependent transferase, partial [Candidatus Sphingobacterium stercoripullorum]|nr:PLP-dependent transferase [Candidatus Sphingobacterium stercoripullorum]